MDYSKLFQSIWTITFGDLLGVSSVSLSHASGKWRCRTEPGHQEWDDELWLALDEDDVCLRNIDRLHMRGGEDMNLIHGPVTSGEKNATGNKRKGCRCFLLLWQISLGRLQILNIQRIDCKLRRILPTINIAINAHQATNTFFTGYSKLPSCPKLTWDHVTLR